MALEVREAEGDVARLVLGGEAGDGVGDGVSITRSYRDAPEIDGYVVVEKELAPGQMVPVLVTGAMEYDLVAVPADEPILVM